MDVINAFNIDNSINNRCFFRRRRKFSIEVEYKFYWDMVF